MMSDMASSVVGRGGALAEDSSTPATQVEEPAEVTEPEIEQIPTAVAGNLSPSAVAAVVIMTMVGFAATIVAGWWYVVKSAEGSEGEDWTQISGLIDKVDNLVLFLLGALFGIAVQQRQTAAARSAAERNAGEVRRQ